MDNNSLLSLFLQFFTSFTSLNGTKTDFICIEIKVQAKELWGHFSDYRRRLDARRK